MAELNSVIPRADDKTILDIFRRLQGAVAPQNMSLQAAGIDQINLLAPDKRAANLIAHLEKSNSHLITHIFLNYQNFNIQYTRNQDSNRLSPFYDEIKINHNNNPGGLEQDQRLRLIELLNSKVMLGNVYRRDEVAARSIEDLQSIYHSTVLKLETAFADQIEKITSWTVEQTSALEQHKVKLTEETATEREQLRKEYETKLDALKLESEALEERRKALDDRDYMHARRGIRSDLQKTIKERQQKFTLTPETRKLRWPVHIAMITLLLALAAANYVNLEILLKFDMTSASAVATALAIGKQTALTALLIGTLLFYVRWMNRWFEQHAAAEFILKQFELDIDRASWVVETAMEWRRDQQSEIPAPLLEGITRDLFSDHNGSPEAHSAADDLASALVGNASQLKLRLGENEVSFDRKGVAGLAKAEVAK